MLKLGRLRWLLLAVAGSWQAKTGNSIIIDWDQLVAAIDPKGAEAKLAVELIKSAKEPVTSLGVSEFLAKLEQDEQAEKAQQEAKKVASAPAKTLALILSELTLKNQDNAELLQLISDLDLMEYFALLQKAGEQPSSLFAQAKAADPTFSDNHNTRKPLNNWGLSQVQQWSELVRSNKEFLQSKAGLAEALSVIGRATELSEGYRPREVQIIAVLLLLQATQHGRLLEVATGEGKSQIVAMFSVLKGLLGHKIDIVTSSTLLASRDAVEKKAFYALFGISVSHNDDIHYLSGLKPCYTADIVYGAIANFQFDYLRHHYSDLNTLGTRQNAIAVVDEVDSMLIDEVSRIAMIASPFAGFEFFEGIYVALWHQLNMIAELFFKHEGQLFWSETKPGKHQDQQDQAAIFAVTDLREFTSTLLRAFAAKLMQETSEHKGMIIPPNLKEVVGRQLDKWINSAITAKYAFQEKKHYLRIKDPKTDKMIIAPVDYLNTGVINFGTSWSDGLHQFLQLKHGVELTPENFVSCFISNAGYFKLYGDNIYGMTGTLGAKDAQDLLASIYNIDFAHLPSFKVKRFEERVGILAADTNEWASELVRLIEANAAENRASLVILESIKDVDLVEVALTVANYPFYKVKRYTGDASENSATEQSMHAGEVILATNVAGRGTDIKLDAKVVAAGGLLVLVGFLPTNLRVEQQAFGRSARGGQPGSAQLVLNLAALGSELQQFANQTIIDLGAGTLLESLKIARNTLESKRLDHVANNEIHQITLKDNLFVAFCGLRKQLKAEGAAEQVIKQAEELWAFWFKEIDNLYRVSKASNDNVATSDLIWQDFEQLTQTILTNYNADNFLKNVNHKIIEGNGYLESDRYATAISSFRQAIVLDGGYAFIAKYNLVLAYVSEGLKTSNQKTYALNYLSSAKLELEDKVLPYWQTLQVLSSLSPITDSNRAEAIEQIGYKVQLLQLQLSYVERAIATIEQGASDSHIKLKHKDELKAMFSHNTQQVAAVTSFAEHGLVTLFDVKELTYAEQFTSLDALGLTCLGVVQIILGAAAIIGSGGLATKFGASLIYEGTKDLYGLITGSISGSFNWKDYWLAKASNYAVSIVMMGWDSFKEGLKSMKAGVAQLTQQAKGLFGQVVTNAATDGTQAAIRQEVVELVQMQVVSAATEVGVMSVANQAMDWAQDVLLAGFYDNLKQQMSQRVAGYFQPANAMLLKLFTIAEATEDNAALEVIRAKILEFTHKQQNAIISFSIPVAKAFLAAKSGDASIYRQLASLMEFAEIASAVAKMMLELDKLGVNITKALANQEVAIKQFEASLDSREREIYNRALAKDRRLQVAHYQQAIADEIAHYVVQNIKGNIVAPATSKITTDLAKDLSESMERYMDKAGRNIDESVRDLSNKYAAEAAAAKAKAAEANEFTWYEFSEEGVLLKSNLAAVAAGDNNEQCLNPDESDQVWDNLKTTDDILDNLAADFTTPEALQRAINNPLANSALFAFSAAGEVAEMAVETGGYYLLKVPGAKYVLGALAKVTEGGKAVVKFVGTKIIGEDAAKSLSDGYSKLPHGMQYLGEMTADGYILGGVGKFGNAAVKAGIKLKVDKLAIKNRVDAGKITKFESYSGGIKLNAESVFKNNRIITEYLQKNPEAADVIKNIEHYLPEFKAISIGKYGVGIRIGKDGFNGGFNSFRIMPGVPNAANIAQQKAYAQIRIGNYVIDANANYVLEQGGKIYTAEPGLTGKVDWSTIKAVTDPTVTKVDQYSGAHVPLEILKNPKMIAKIKALYEKVNTKQN